MHIFLGNRLFCLTSKFVYPNLFTLFNLLLLKKFYWHISFIQYNSKGYDKYFIHNINLFKKFNEIICTDVLQHSVSNYVSLFNYNDIPCDLSYFFLTNLAWRLSMSVSFQRNLWFWFCPANNSSLVSFLVFNIFSLYFLWVCSMFLFLLLLLNFF